MKIYLLFAAFTTSVFAQFQTPLAATQLPPETVVATVEGKDVTLADVRKMLDADPRLAQPLQQDPRTAIAQVFMLRYLAAEGDRRKLAEQSPLKDQLETMRSAVVASALVNLERDTYPVSSEMMDAYFLAHRPNYEQAHIKAIYVAFKPGAPPAAAGTSQEALAEAAKRAFEAAHAGADRSEAQAESLAKEIVQKIRAGADFSKMVEQYSDDASSKAAGGDFGVIKPNSSFPENLRKVVFAMNANDIADPVKSGNAYYIIRLEEKVMPPIDDVRGEILQNIRQEHLDGYVKGLTDRFKPEVKNVDFFARPGAILGAR